MNINYNGKKYEVKIIKKNIKNTYIRVKEDMIIYVTTNYFTPDNYIKKLVEDNIINIYKMIDRQTKKLKKKSTITCLEKSTI